MKAILLFFLFVSSCSTLAQTDTNLLAVGDWSESVNDRGHWLRGRLLVYDDQGESASGHARIYLELQHVFHGAWNGSIDFYFDPGFRGDDLHFELRDAFDKPLPRDVVSVAGVGPASSWVTLPCDSTVRLRADMATLGSEPNSKELAIFVNTGHWTIHGNATNEFFFQPRSLLQRNAPARSIIMLGRAR